MGAVKSFRPITPVQRYKTVLDRSLLTDKKPERRLVESYKETAGRNNHGRITSRHKGGGHKQLYRIIDFKRDKKDIAGKVLAIEYDPNRSSFIALIGYKDGDKRYILAPEGLVEGSPVISSDQAEISVGNAMPLSRIPLGMFIHNIEMTPGKGGQLARTAGVYAEVVAKENKFVQVKLPSGEVRNLPEHCYATLGQVGNLEHEQVVLGSAGRSRYLGRRPHVRGMCMNPVDHPNGGGEGRSKSGGGWHTLRSPWGGGVRGKKTRKRNKHSNQMIVKRRK